MAAIGFLPALGLLIGATLGLNTSLGAWPCACALPLTCLGAFVCWCCRAPRGTLVIVLAGFLAGGAALAVSARGRALNSPARQILDREFGGFLIESIGPAGRHDPLPSRVVLVEDASPRDGFVSLRADVIAVQIRGVWQPAGGGIALSVNGTPRQSSNISQLIWSAAECIAYLSQHETIEPGDIVMTGTPEGVGAVVPGDVMRGSIAGLGELEISVTD